MKRIKKIKISYAFIFFLIVLIIPYCYLSFFTQPNAEDFGLSFKYQQSDFIQLLKTSYLNRNGRYIANILMYLNPISFHNYLGYKLIPLLMITLIVIGNILLVRALFWFLSKSVQIIIALILSLLYLHNMPIISEGLYWYTGAVIYNGGIICSLFYMVVFVKLMRNRNKPNRINSFILTLLLFLSCGFNEVLSLLIPYLLFIITIIYFKSKNEFKKVVLGQLIFSILFSSILIFSPGNVLREAMYSNNNIFTSSFYYSLLQTVRFSSEWLLISIALIPASILYYPIHQKWKEHSLWVKNSFYLNKWISVLILFSIIFICVFPPYWSTGILGQHRTLNVACFFFIIMWFINLSVWINATKKTNALNFSSKLLYIVGSLLIVSFIISGNGYHAVVDIFSGDAQRYDAQLNERFEKLMNAKRQKNKTILIPTLKNKSKSLFVLDISKDPKYWTNQSYNLYFRLDSNETFIVLKDD